jgi:hypothetical protein
VQSVHENAPASIAAEAYPLSGGARGKGNLWTPWQ